MAKAKDKKDKAAKHFKDKGQKCEVLADRVIAYREDGLFLDVVETVDD